MNVKAVLFDLDGTLLPMDQDQFVMSYFMGLAKWLAPKGYEPGKLKEVFWAGVAAMVKNDGSFRSLTVKLQLLKKRKNSFPATAAEKTPVQYLSVRIIPTVIPAVKQ